MATAGIDLDLESPAVAAALRVAGTVAIAVAARGGPHVTPQAFVSGQGRLWVATPRTSVKARVLRARPVAGVRLGDTVVLAGTVELLDPTRPLAAIGNVGDVLRSVRALPNFALRHGGTIASVVMDTMANPLPFPQPRLVAVIEPYRLAVLDEAGDVQQVTGEWPPSPSHADVGDAGRAGDRERPSGRGLPDAVAKVVASPARATLGWSLGDGVPLALPVQWDPDEGVARLRASLATLAGVGGSAKAALTLDGGDDSIAGVMFRGRATASDAGGGDVTIRLAVARTTWWAGTKSATLVAPEDPA